MTTNTFPTRLAEPQESIEMNYAEASIEELYDRGTELRKAMADLPEHVQTEEEGMRVRSLLDEVDVLDHALTLAEHQKRREEALVIAGTGAPGSDSVDLRSFGERVITQELVDWVIRGGAPSEAWDIGDGMSLDQMLHVRAVNEFGASGGGSAVSFNSVDSSGAGYLLPNGQPIAPVPRQARLYLRDLFPKMTTTLAAIPYVQELNPTSYESASAVAEGGVKPNATLSFQGAKADPTVIAATLVISKQLFEDAAAVVQYINTRLPYLVRFKEDNEFLNGSGTWPDIQGVLNTSGVQSQSAVNSDNAQTLGAAFAKVENSDGTPTAVVLNPTNAWNMFTKRAAGGSGTFDAGTPFSALPLTVWGVPSYRTRAMPANSALVADFELGGMIADREQVNVQTYRERYAELNQILLVCEERVGLLVFRPDLFVNATLV